MSMPPDGRVATDSPTTAPPVNAVDVERQTTVEGSGLSKIVHRWRRHDLLNKASLALRLLTLISSLIAFIFITSNQHGDWEDFQKYQQYIYVFAIAIISTIYTGLQAFYQLNELSSGREFVTRHNKMMLDFFADQLLAYLMLSATSSAVPLTYKMSEETSNLFTDSCTVAITMEFLAFFGLALSALISGFKLGNQS